jgi:serine acetyltransferase
MKIEIGDDVLIGAGFVVVRYIPDEAVTFGVPVRVVKGRREQENDAPAHAAHTVYRFLWIAG